MRAGLVFVTSLTVAVAAMTGGPAAAVDAVDCTDVLFLGARGSGQPQSGSGGDGGTGLGPQVYGVAQRLARQLPGQSITVSAVQYPAQGVELLATAPNTYFGGLEGGVVDVQNQLRGRAAACPAERIVLSGYSQGAMVVHRALQDLDRAGDPTARQILARTDGVVLISDGDRRPRDRATSYGTAGRSRGIGFDQRPGSGARGTKRRRHEGAHPQRVPGLRRGLRLPAGGAYRPRRPAGGGDPHGRVHELAPRQQGDRCGGDPPALVDVATYGTVTYGCVGTRGAYAERRQMTLATDARTAPTTSPDPVQLNSLGMRVTIGFFVVIPLIAVALAIPVAWGGWLSWVDVVLVFVMWTITAGGITVGYHRYFTHGSFKARRPVKIALGDRRVDGTRGLARPVGGRPSQAPRVLRRRG